MPCPSRSTAGWRRPLRLRLLPHGCGGLKQESSVCYLGYYAVGPHAGRGLMAEGLSLVVDDAFRWLRLHRLEANIQPANARSIQLVRRLGFRREGYSARYLRILGRWRDHERWAILADGNRRRRPPLARRPRRVPIAGLVHELG